MNKHKEDDRAVLRDFLKHQPKETRQKLKKVLRERGLLGKDERDDDDRG
jgi:hypothetical protein